MWLLARSAKIEILVGHLLLNQPESCPQRESVESILAAAVFQFLIHRLKLFEPRGSFLALVKKNSAPH